MILELTEAEALSLHHFAHEALQLELKTRPGVRRLDNDTLVFERNTNMDLHTVNEALRKLRRSIRG